MKSGIGQVNPTLECLVGIPTGVDPSVRTSFYLLHSGCRNLRFAQGSLLISCSSRAFKDSTSTMGMTFRSNALQAAANT